MFHPSKSISFNQKIQFPVYPPDEHNSFPHNISLKSCLFIASNTFPFTRIGMEACPDQSASHSQPFVCWSPTQIQDERWNESENEIKMNEFTFEFFPQVALTRWYRISKQMASLSASLVFIYKFCRASKKQHLWGCETIPEERTRTHDRRIHIFYFLICIPLLCYLSFKWLLLMGFFLGLAKKMFGGCCWGINENVHRSYGC